MVGAGRDYMRDQARRDNDANKWLRDEYPITVKAADGSNPPDIIDWCRENDIEHIPMGRFMEYRFRDDIDAMAFKLRWC